MANWLAYIYLSAQINLVKHLPLDWSEHRRMFGVAAEKTALPVRAELAILPRLSPG